MTILELTTESALAAGGAAVARSAEGRVVFVEGAAPDERVRARVVKDNPRFLRALTIEVVEPSPDRVEPACPHFGVCGGCSLQHVSAQAQLRSKQDALLTTLHKLGGVKPQQVEPPWSGPAYGYRSRARLAVGPEGRVGYRRAKGHRVVPVDRCPILMPSLERVVPQIRAPAGGDRPRSLAAVTDGARVCAAWLGGVGRGPSPPIDGLEWAVDGVDAELTADGVRLHPRVFSQANPQGNLAVRATVDAWLRGFTGLRRAVELYAGSGNFSLVLADHAARVETFEAAADAVALAKRVVPDHVYPAVADAEAAVAHLGPADVVFVDPPRAGMSASVLSTLPRWADRAIVYVSCDPATFARDAGRLDGLGWALRSVRLFDLYPQTAHAEVAGLFTPVADTSAASSD